MKHLDLFSGIGGFAYAAQQVWGEQLEIVGFCEIEKFPQQVLRKNFPGIPIYPDINELDGKLFKGVQLVTGGFPCQDISIAGINNGRKGLEGSKSGLFYKMFDVIDGARPVFIVYENSPMIIGNTLKIIHGLLKEIGYVNTGKELTAREFGFPHKRKRYYGLSIANTCGIGLNEIAFRLASHFEMQRQEIFRSGKGRKTNFSRTFSRALQSPSDSDILRVFDGIPPELDRNRIKALGNAIVPQVAIPIMQVIKEIDEEICKPDL